MTTATLTTNIDAASFEYVRKLVLDHSSIALEPNKGYLVESRLVPIARKNSFPNVIELVAKLRRLPHGDLHEQVIDAMTTNETSFFRDIHPFENLRATVLPELIQRRAALKTLNIWSAACSSGQEPYTIAMVLRDNFPQLANWNVKLFATDLSQEMLNRAAAGVYNQSEVNRGLPAASVVKHFVREGLNWVVKPDIRQSISFLRLNLTESWNAIPTMDIIFMRNVLIYFTHDTKRLILNKVHRQLSKDGVLLLGGAETTLGLNENFARVNLGKTTLYRPSAITAPVRVAQ